MRKRRVLALLTLAALVFSAYGVQAWTAPRETSASNLPVLLRSGPLHMTESTMQTTAEAEPDSSERNLYIVQLTGPVQEAQKDALRRAGAEVGDYVPENAFLVRMAPSAKTEVAKLSFVKGVAFYGASAKRDPALAQIDGEVLVRIATFDSSTEASMPELTSLGLKPDSIGSGIMTAKVDQSQLDNLVASSSVVYVEPIRSHRLSNDKAAGIMGATTAWDSKLDGTGQVVAITDTGLDSGKNDGSLHPDFQGQVKALYALGRSGDASDHLAHGTHVAGSVLGTGAASNGLYKGMAPGAKLVFQSVADSQGGLSGIPQDLTQLFNQGYEAGARIHTNSWGVPATQGGTVYDAQSAAVDRFMWEHPDYAILFAAGNDGDHDRDGQTNYSTVSTPGTAKNAITVGASQNDRPDKKMATDVSDMAPFSSRGPTADGRVKPDIVAPGTWIASTRSSLSSDSGFWAPHESNDKYGYMGGTSMATPLTAGTTALVRQYYMDKLGVTPRASLLKATLINGAAAMQAGISWKDSGWGRVDLKNTLYGRPFKYVNEEKALQTGEGQTYTYTVKEGQPLKVTLVWTDYPATPAAEKILVNDLDLTVKAPDGTVVKGNHMLGTTPDRTNNVENVVVESPKAGTYSVTVQGQNVPQGPQRFALVVSGQVDGGSGKPTPPPENPSPPISDKEAPVVSITTPAANEQVSGTVTLTAKATDNVGVSKVIFYVDGQEVGTAAADPYTAAWDTTRSGNGVHRLVANAYDAAGNVGISKEVAVNVQDQAVSGVQELQFGGRAAGYGTVGSYYLDVKAGGQVDAKLALQGRANTSLVLLDPSGRQVAQGSSLLYEAPVAGTYTLVVVNSGGTADYLLKVRYDPASTTVVESGSGSLATNGQRSQVHTVTLKAPGSLNASVLAGDSQAKLDLYLVNRWGQVVAYGNSPNLNPESLSARLPAGTYYVYVVINSGRTDYQLTLVHP